jgi:hypothetical protein
MKRMLNRSNPTGTGPALLHYGTPDFAVLKPGTFVRCAVTGTPIPLEELRYWSPELQEAYVDAQTAAKRWQETNAAG